MEGLEKLSLADLDFSGDTTFEINSAGADELAKLGKKDNESGNANETKDNDSDDKKLDKDGNPIIIVPSQESVANDKDNTSSGGKTSKADGEGSNSSSPKLNDTEQLYSNLASELKAKGVLPGLENTASIKTLDDFNAAIKKEVESGLTNRQKAISDAMKLGVPANEIAEQLEVISKLEGITDDYINHEDSSAFRKNVIKQDFMSKGYTKDRAETFAQRSIDDKTDIEDAKFALKNIIDSEKKRYDDTLSSAKKKEDDSISEVKTYIDKNTEILPGIKLSKEQSDELYERITTDLGNKENAFMQSQRRDPIGSRIKLEAIAFLTKDFTDFTIFKTSSESDITNSIENLLRGTSFTADGQVQTEVKDPNANFTLSDLKDLDFE